LHVRSAEKGAEGAEGVGYTAAALDDGFEGSLGFDIPFPGVF
jgi:hypothetical protein